MKKSILVMLTFILAAQCTISAQEEQKDYYRKKIVTYSKMKSAGTTMTIGGIVLTAVGIATIVNNSKEVDPYGYISNENENAILLGMITTELGVGLAAGGAVLWAIGGSKKAKYRKKLNALSLNLNSNINSKLSLVYRF